MGIRMCVLQQPMLHLALLPPTGSRSVCFSSPRSRAAPLGSTIPVADAREFEGGIFTPGITQALTDCPPLPPQTDTSLCLPPSHHPAQRGDPHPRAVHHVSLHRLHGRQPSLLPVHHSCLRPVPLRCLPCRWLRGLRLHGHGAAAAERQHPCGARCRLRAVPAAAAAARPHAVSARVAPRDNLWPCKDTTRTAKRQKNNKRDKTSKKKKKISPPSLYPPYRCILRPELFIVLRANVNPCSLIVLMEVDFW